MPIRSQFFFVTYFTIAIFGSQIGLSGAQEATPKSSAADNALAYVDMLAAGEFEKAAATFEPNMAKAMSVAQLKDAWNSVQSVGGKLKSRKVAQTDKVRQAEIEYDAVIVNCEFEKASFDSRLVYAPDGKLSGMFFRPAKPKFVGKEELWLGELNAGLTKLRIMIHLGKNENKKDIATFDSLDQGQKGLVFDAVTVDGNKIKLESKQLGLAFEGEFNEARTEVGGKWKQGLIPLTLNLKLVDVEPEAKRPQTPKAPFPYDSHELSYESQSKGVKLAGTLTIPEGKGPFPAVVLITGSGSQDRDETIFGHKPFFVLADHLTRQGIAVLRVDDRGVGGSSGPVEATSAEYADDVRAGVAQLKSRPEIDAKKIGLLGHSEGGIIALMIAADSKDIAFIVLMASSAFPGKDILFQQGEALLKASGASETELAMQRQIQTKLFEIIAATADNTAAQKAMEIAVAELAKTLDEENRKLLTDQEAQVKSQLKTLTGKWFRFFLSYDPAKAAEKVTCPVLALNGELDLQVLPKENLGVIEAALKKGKNGDFQIKQFRKLNHLFQTCETGQVSEYGRIEETIAPQVLDEISGWIVKRFVKK
jgi:uncharacterized protein